MLYRSVLATYGFGVMLMVVGCKKESGNQAPSRPPGASQPGTSGVIGTGPGGPRGKPSPIQAIMARLTKGEQSLTKVIGEELEADPPPWDNLQAQTKEFVELAGSMGKHEPPKGSKESWAKLTTHYSASAAALEKAVQGKDKEAALTAHRMLSSSCMACHRAHRGMRDFLASSEGEA